MVTHVIKCYHNWIKLQSTTGWEPITLTVSIHIKTASKSSQHHLLFRFRHNHINILTILYVLYVDPFQAVYEPLNSVQMNRTATYPVYRMCVYTFCLIFVYLTYK